MACRPNGVRTPASIAGCAQANITSQAVVGNLSRVSSRCPSAFPIPGFCFGPKRRLRVGGDHSSFSDGRLRGGADV
jgi:hypothetical protein